MRRKKDVESVMFDITAKYDGPAKVRSMCCVPIIVYRRAMPNSRIRARRVLTLSPRIFAAPASAFDMSTGDSASPGYPEFALVCKKIIIDAHANSLFRFL